MNLKDRLDKLADIEANGCDMVAEGCPLANRSECVYCQPSLYARVERSLIEQRYNRALDLAKQVDSQRLRPEELAEALAVT